MSWEKLSTEQYFFLIYKKMNLAVNSFETYNFDQLIAMTFCVHKYFCSCFYVVTFQSKKKHIDAIQYTISI